MNRRFQWKLPESGFPGQFLKPNSFFVSTIVGFLLCCLLGYICSLNQRFENFSRFHLYISPYTMYFPSFGQMVSLTRAARPDQTFVIIGGNSLLRGYGQNRDELWSKKLQQDLGDRYYVINYAIDGAVPFEGGAWVAEMLLKQNRKVIFITSAEPRRVSAPYGHLLTQVFFDFYNKKHLLPNARRDAALRERLDFANPVADRSAIENEIGKKMDQLSYSSELWQWVGHNLFFTVWSAGTHPDFMKPRRLYEDNENFAFEQTEEEYETIKTKIIADENSMVVKNPDEKWIPLESAWEKSDHEAELVADELLRHTIIVVPRHGPKLLDHFSRDQVRKHDAILEIAAGKWRSRGADSLIVSGSTPQSYRDMIHFSASGGAEFAHMLAERIRANSQRLGYE